MALYHLNALENACDPLDTHNRGYIVVAQAYAHVISGDYETATAKITQAEAMARMDGDPGLLARCWAVTARAASPHDPEMARHAADQAMRYAHDAGRLDLYDQIERMMAPVLDREYYCGEESA